MAAKKSPPRLHELEAEVMEEVWAASESVTVRDIRTELNGHNRRKKRAYTTVMTIMARLHEKGLLRRELRGKTYHYRPALSADQYAHARAAVQVDELIGDYGDVALAQFARQVEGLDERRLATLRALAEEDEV